MERGDYMERNGMEGAKSEKERGGGFRGTEVAVRVVAGALTLAAAVVMGVNKQSKTVALSLLPGAAPIFVPATAKSSYLSAFVYFVVANSIATVFAALTVVLAFVRCQASPHAIALMATCDMMVAALLFSANGAAGAVALLGREGNSHLMWNKVCNQFDRFCNNVLASLVISLLASVAFLVMVLLALHKLRRN